MSLRLNLANPEDRAFLERKGVDVKELAKRQSEKYVKSRVIPPNPHKDQPEGSRKSKYRNKRVEYQGLKFDSHFELQCWIILEELEVLKKIRNLKRQVKVEFIHNGVKIMGSRPDFYFEVQVEDRLIPVYADAKSVATAKLRPFKIAQNLFKAFYGQEMLVFKAGQDIAEAIEHHALNLS